MIPNEYIYIPILIGSFFIIMGTITEKIKGDSFNSGAFIGYGIGTLFFLASLTMFVAKAVMHVLSN